MIGVIDTSAFLRLFIPDGPLPTGLEAFFRGVERGDHTALAPELMSVEAANVVNKKRLASLLAEDECCALIDLFGRFPVRYESHAGLIQPAYEIAAQRGLTVYDALYLALAKRHAARLFTSDEKLGRAALALGL